MTTHENGAPKGAARNAVVLGGSNSSENIEQARERQILHLTRRFVLSMSTARVVASLAFTEVSR